MSSITNELLALKGVIVRYVIILFAVFVALLILAPGEWQIAGRTVPGPVFGALSFAQTFFLAAKEMLIPETVLVVALGPVAPFVAPIVIAFLVALLATFPAGLVLLYGFLAPALRPKERRTAAFFTLPAIVLFYAGAAFAYFIVIPETFAILYSFAQPMDVAPMFALDEFISSVFLLTLSTGIAFLLPIIMAASAKVGLIPASFWARHWRGAILSAVIFSAVITPDGSGVTMALLTGPLLALYAFGTIAAACVAPRRVL
jgi:sec-independent protein translocase protein TatC